MNNYLLNCFQIVSINFTIDDCHYLESDIVAINKESFIIDQGLITIRELTNVIEELNAVNDPITIIDNLITATKFPSMVKAY